MDLVTCPNCRSVYGDVQDRCPTCGADHAGEDARIEFDGATRTAISRLGGMFGGILAAPGPAHALWCSRGVALYSDETGLVWHTRTRARVEGVDVTKETVELVVAGRPLSLRLEDGEEVEG